MARGKRPSSNDHSTREKSATTTKTTSRRNFVAGIGAAGAAAVVSKPKSARAATGDKTYRIHPAIGVARVGNVDLDANPDQFFIGPEAPGYGPLKQAGDANPGSVAPLYKHNGLVKPQAARFRIYEYTEDANGRLVAGREVTLGEADVVSITWTVHLANKKASFYRFMGRAGEAGPANATLRNATVTNRRSLEIDFGPRSVGGASAGPVRFRHDNIPAGYSGNVPVKSGSPIIPYLGQLRTDAQGRLVALGARGATGYSTATQPTMPSYANNDGWFDDISDGPVTAVIQFAGGATITVGPNGGGAWLLCAPPDFAPGIPGSVSAYDLLFDMGVRSSLPIAQNAMYFGGPLDKLRRLRDGYEPGTANVFPTFTPSFVEDIRPILLGGYHLWWVDGLVTSKHNSLIASGLGSLSAANDAARTRVFSYMRAPLGIPQSGVGSMPKALGDDPYTSGLPEAVKHLPLTPTQYGLLSAWASRRFTEGGTVAPATITPHGLDRAALENCMGGAFFPGIEVSWQIRNAALFTEPFRIGHDAVSQYLTPSGTIEGTKIGPGHFSRQMAVPWQADFNDCRNEGTYAWWPSARPTDVLPSKTATRREVWARPTTRFEGRNTTSTHEDMVKHWYKFGFVVEQPSSSLDSDDLFIETERAATIP